MKYIIYFMMMLYGSLCHAIVCKHIVERSERILVKCIRSKGMLWVICGL